MSRAVSNAEVVVSAVPSAAVRSLAHSVLKQIPGGAFIVSAAKGLEDRSLKTMTEIWAEELRDKTRVATLSGPSFAEEVLQGLPTAVTLAGYDEEATKEMLGVFHSDSFRVYLSGDVKGVEIGGAAKNIIAMAIGMVDGVELGANARAAVLTRGLAEIQRLVAASGGNPLTAIGLSGLGDLFLTSTGDLSRNRRVGLALARGEKLRDILRSLGQVAEGVETAPKIYQLAQNHDVEVPITREVNRVLCGESSVRESIATLLARAPKREQ
jgi:glycerol-3-phosphate dehydrogenase (NAD(P)+)